MERFPEEKSALIAIDVQHGFLSDYTQVALPRIRDLMRASTFDLKVATRFHNPPDSQFRRLIHWNGLSSAKDVRLDSVVEANADEVVDKHTYGAGAALLDILQKHHIETVLIVGIDTDVCVLQNAGYLFDSGIEVWVDLNGCATNGGPEADKAASALMKRTIGHNQVITRAGENR